MLEKPNIPDDLIITGLRGGYGFDVAGVEFLPIGYEATVWIYRVDTADGGAYFLKLRRGVADPATLAVPRLLREAGVSQVVAPVPAQSGGLHAPLDEQHFLVVYPFITGHNAMETGLDAAQWEAFALPWAAMVKRLDADITNKTFNDPVQQEFAAFWRGKQAKIRQVMAQAEAIAQQARAQAGPIVLCHTDIHTANVLIGVAGALYIVDWDAPLLAPKERDLMFIPQADSIEGTAFYHGYGPAEINRVVLDYYRYEWAVQELGDFGERVFCIPGFGEATRRDSLRGFKQLFAPGGEVAAL
jgi:spectinomycin phosphotransferase